MATPEEFVFLIEANEATDDILRSVLSELPVEQLDLVSVEKNVRHDGELAYEPITASVALAATAGVSYMIFRLVEKWMEQNHQLETLKIVHQAASEDLPSEVVSVLADLSKKYADVSISHGPIQAPKSVGSPGGD